MKELIQKGIAFLKQKVIQVDGIMVTVGAVIVAVIVIAVLFFRKK